MIISNKNKYIYLAVPKTGTVSVQKYLLKSDKTANKNSIEIGGESFKFGGHMTALAIKKVLGDYYNNYNVIGFVRHPYGRIVSSYFFYKKGAKSWAWEGREKEKPIDQKLKIKLAKILPFHIWALVYPYKSNMEYFFDENDNLIVDMKNIGLFEDLGNDLKKILSKADVTLENEMSHENKSIHGEIESYFKYRFFKWLINLKVKKDLAFYKLVVSKKQ